MLTWLGAACLAVVAMVASVPLSGTVVDADGHPAAGVSVWLGDTHADHKGPETLATAETDGEGRFLLQRPDDLEGRGASWSPTLWAHKAGFRVAHLEFKWGPPAADAPVRLALGPAAATTIRVVRPDGSPAAGARVRPTRLNPSKFNAPRPPDALLDRLAVTTDADGRATIDGFAPGDLRAVDVTVENQLVQTLSMPRLPAGSKAEAATLALRPLGRLAVRIVGGGGDADAPLKGWRVTVNTRPADPNYSGPFTHWRRETTDDDGRITFEPMAEGRLSWDIDPPEGSDYLVAKPPEATMTIREGGTTEAEILVLRGVRVEGVVRVAPGDRPVPGVKAELVSFESTARPVVRIQTDAEGRFSGVLPPGRCRFSYTAFDLPKDYLIPAGAQSWVDFTIKEGEALHAVDPPALGPAARVAGRVVDDRGEPAPGALVQGGWSVPGPGLNGRVISTATTSGDIQGRFELGRVAPGVEITVTASRAWLYESDPVIVPRAGEGEPITVRLKRKPTSAVSGRVLDADGNPLTGALVRIRVRPTALGSYAGSSVFEFEGGREIRADADGRFTTPDQIPTDLSRQIEASAPGWAAGLSKWLETPDAQSADLRLRRAIGVRELAGRVVDSFGNPVAGAEVVESLDEPRWERRKTDAGGRFALAEVADAPALVFASKDGFRFLGRRVEPSERSVDLVLRSFAEPPPAPLRPVASPISREQERAIARELIADARASVADDEARRATPSLDEAEAWADPDRIIAMIENQARRPDSNLLAAAAISRSQGDPAAMLRFLDAVGEPDSAATVALGIFNRLGSSVRLEFRRELLDQAERRARDIAEANQRAGQLIRVADRRLDLGETDRGAALVREVQKLRDEAAPERFPNARDELIPVLARVDLAEALKLLEAKAERGGGNESFRIMLDRTRMEIAQRIAPSNLDGARRLLDLVKPDDARRARRAIRLSLARTSLEAARSLESGDGDPFIDALLPAIAAKAKAATDPAAARELLRESVERLAAMSSARGAGSLALARLLPLAARVDPDRAPGDLWLALARRPSTPADGTVELQPVMTPGVARYYLDLAELAALVARYDRGAAEVVFAPVAVRLGNMVEGEPWGLGHDGLAALAAAAAYDARAAKALVDALPNDPPPPKPGEPGVHRADKFNARVAVARVLGLPPALRLRAPFATPPVAEGWVAAIED